MRMAGGMAMAALLLAGAMVARAQESSSASDKGPVVHGSIAVNVPPSYDNKWDLFGGLSYMNWTAGPLFIPRSNSGGGEVMLTRWFTGPVSLLHAGPNRLGLVADLRGEYGTTPVHVNPYGLHRTLVYQNMGLFGATVRGPSGPNFALNAHVLGGSSRGDFSKGTEPAAPPTAVGLYTNRWAPIGAIGASIDYNLQRKIALRFQPDLMLSHWGDATDTNFYIAIGFVYHFDHK